MTSPTLDELPQSQKERLRFIDFRLLFLSTLNRNDLISRFGIKAAAATRDIAAYRELRPRNAEYDSNLKSYLKTSTFSPLFSYEAQEVLKTLSTGVGDDSVIVHKSLVSCEVQFPLTTPNTTIIAILTSAIYTKRAVTIRYYSTSSGLSVREVVPLALVNNGLRWHVRCYDRLKSRFADFVLTRIAEAEQSSMPPIDSELLQSDHQWNRMVDLILVPHPERKNPEPIQMDYGMIEGSLRMTVRAATAGYLLRLWNVDCSPDHSLKDEAHQLWLKNTATLYGVSNLEIAPGYRAEEE